MRHRPSVTDVATLAQVSVGTVSNVLNRPDRVATATRTRVEAAIAELGFVPSASARQLRAGVARSVGAIVLDVANPFFTSVMRGIEDRLAAESLALMVSSTDGEVDRESHFLRLFEQHEVRGILVTPAGPDRTALAAVRDRGTRVVLVDADGESDFPAVSVDDVQGGQLAVDHLLALGRRRIHVVNGPSTIQQCLDRLTGARRAVTQAGLDPEAVLTQTVIPTLDADAGEAAAHALLALPEGSRPDAVFCVNDMVALGVLRTLLRAGVEVPERIAVVGYDDVAFAGMLLVPLTTVRQPTHEIGWSAADLLLQPDPAAAEQVRFSPELVVRASSVRTG